MPLLFTDHIIDINQSLPCSYQSYYSQVATDGNILSPIFHPMYLAHIISVADAPNVLILDLQSINS